jgi:hypothetical protein
VRELPLITATIKAFSRGEVRVRKGRVVDASWQLIAGYDLSAQIDRMIQDKGLL